VFLCLRFTPNECVKDRLKPVNSYATFAASACVSNLAFCIDSTDVRTLSVCQTHDAMLIRFHIEMPPAPYNIAMLDAHLLCG